MKFSYSSIRIADLIHNDLECYIQSGYGGENIIKWPFYSFIKKWINGNHESAKNLWVEWLVNEFTRYCLEEKSKGGMYQGSVHRYSVSFLDENKNESWVNPSLLNKKFVHKGAKKLVDRRIEMVRSIIDKGYQNNLNDPIIAVKTKNKYMLKGGHHRATVMYILGYEKLPEIKIYSKSLWELREWLVKIKKYLK